jgi:low affinity Fe/Cu permease
VNVALSRVANRLTDWGSAAVTTVLALGLVAAWVVGGLIAGFSTEYQIPANTITTLVTFILGFAILHSQARDTAALQLKLDTLIAADQQANNAVINAETLSDEDLQAMIAELQALAGGRNG